MSATPLIVLDMGVRREQAANAAPASARSMVDSVPKGSMRVSLTPDGTQQVVVPLRLFLQERERQLARALNRALAALFRTLARTPRAATPRAAAIVAFEQHGFTAAEFAQRLMARVDGQPYFDPRTQADAVAIVLAGITRGMPPSRLALAVLSFALDTPAAVHTIGSDRHLFDAYARIVLHVDFDDTVAHARLARPAIRFALLNPLERAGLVQKSKAERMRLAYERQLYEDENKLFAEIVAPTVCKMALIILSALPVGWLGRAGVLIFQAVIGFFQFLETFFEARADDTVSEAEASELRWAAIGIIPFLPLQLLVAGHAVAGVGATLLQHIYEGMQQFLTELPMRSASADAGFDGFCVTDPEYAFFVPDGFET